MKRSTFSACGGGGAVLLVLLLAACENPIDYTTDHLEAIEVIVRDTRGRELARTVQNERWEGQGLVDGSLPFGTEEVRELRVRFLNLAGEEFGLDEHATHRLRVEWEPEGVVLWEPLDTVERFHALKPGSAGARLLIWHQTHPDFISPPLPVHVTPRTDGTGS